MEWSKTKVELGNKLILEGWLEGEFFGEDGEGIARREKNVQPDLSWAYPGNRDINKYGIDCLEYIRCLMRMNKHMYVNRN